MTLFSGLLSHKSFKAHCVLLLYISYMNNLYLLFCRHHFTQSLDVVVVVVVVFLFSVT